MARTIEATIDKDGTVCPYGEASQPNETAILSEAALAQDWSRPEEDAAWSHLQSVVITPQRPLNVD